MGRDISRGESAYVRLKEAIQQGGLQPGMRVREVEIATRFGISRTPAREAIRRLETEGLISFVPHHGAVISSLDHQETMELYDLREILEGAAAGFAARHASEAELEELDELVGAELTLADHPERLAELNRVFHGAMYRAAHNRFLERALLSLRDSIGLLGGTSLKVEGRADSAHAEHVKIVTALVTRDSDAAQDAARDHVRSAQRTRLKMLRGEFTDDDAAPRGGQ